MQGSEWTGLADRAGACNADDYLPEQLACYDYMRGDYRTAAATQIELLNDRKNTLGGEHPDTLRAMDSLALTLSAQGELGGARELQAQLLALMRRVLGEQHPNTLTAMNNLMAIEEAEHKARYAR